MAMAMAMGSSLSVTWRSKHGQIMFVNYEFCWNQISVVLVLVLVLVSLLVDLKLKKQGPFFDDLGTGARARARARA